MSACLHHRAGRGLATLLTALGLYGCWSTPGLAARWGVSGAGVVLLGAWAALAGWALATAVRTPRRASRRAPCT